MVPYGKRPDMLVHEQEPFNAEPAALALAGSPVTPMDAFYVRGHGPVPDLDAAAWRLDVGKACSRSVISRVRRRGDLGRPARPAGVASRWPMFSRPPE
jgi:hypothetical protein